MRGKRASLVSASVVAFVCVVAGGPASALTPKNPRAAREIRRERHETNLLNTATERAQRATKSCRTGYRQPKTTVTQDATPQAVKNGIAALRRPAVADDAVDVKKQAYLGLGEVYADSVRTLTASDGRRFVLLVARRSDVRFVVAASCLDAQHRALVRILRGESPGVRSSVLRSFQRQRRFQEREAAKPPEPPHEAIYFFDRTSRGLGSGGGGSDLAQLRKSGMFNSSSGASHRRATVTGLVPDGVATIDVTFAKRVPHGKLYKPTVYPTTIRKTVRVHDNVVVFDVRRAASGAFPTRMVWRDAQGNVVRVVNGD